MSVRQHKFRQYWQSALKQERLGHLDSIVLLFFRLDVSVDFLLELIEADFNFN